MMFEFQDKPRRNCAAMKLRMPESETLDFCASDARQIPKLATLKLIGLLGCEYC